MAGRVEFDEVTRLLHALTEGSLTRSVDDVERIDRIRQFEALKGAIAAAQMSEAVALGESRRAESVLRGESVTRQRQAVSAAAGEIGLARRISPAQARVWAGNARVLTGELPATFTALREGRTTEWRALLVARETVFLSREDRARADRDLAPRIEFLSDRGIESEARRLAQRLDPAGAAERARNAAKDRRVTLRPAPDAMCRLSALVPVAQGVAGYAALRQHADTLIGVGQQGVNTDGSLRSRDQVMADTLIERLTGQACAEDVTVEINLIMTDRTLFSSAAAEPAIIPGYGPVPAPVARDLATRDTTASRWIRRLYLTPERTQLAAMDSRRRSFTGNQARFIRLRDHTTCRTPWCDAPARHIDHVTDWADSHRTSVTDGQGYCEACNYTKQQRGWQTTRTEWGEIVTITPTGHRYTSSLPRSTRRQKATIGQTRLTRRNTTTPTALRTRRLMGWENPEIPWRELERRLSGRPIPIGEPFTGDGGDSPAWSRKRTAYEAASVPRPDQVVPFAELHAHSSFSFLDGASSPEELIEEGVRLGLDSLTLTDHDGVYGVVRFAEAARAHGLPTGFGAELSLDAPIARTQSEVATAARVGVPDPPGTHLLALARDPDGYARLSRTLGQAHLRGGAKGRPHYDAIETLGEAADGHWLVLTGCRKGSVRQALERDGEAAASRALDRLVRCFGRDNVAVELTYDLDPLADERYEALAALASQARLPLVATTAAHYHGPPRRPLATALAAVRARSSLDEIDGWLPSWSGQHVRSGAEMLERFRRWPDAVDNASRLGKEISFELHLIAPSLPPFPCPDGLSEMQYLRKLTYDGARRWFGGKKHEAKAYDVLEHELDTIEQLGFPGYFLVVWDIARFCRENGILCQGRGSAANSAVCYALQITAVDPVFYDLMFERFLGPERGEPPDIDIDIESDRREEAIQYVYRLHGREHAAQVANVITYRPKSAVRDVAKALGYSEGQQDAWSKEIEQGYYWSYTTDNGTLPPITQTTEEQLAEVPARVVQLASELQNAPRHLGIHSGGMVMCDRPVIEVCPVEWGRMEGRTVLQWDKDDCADIGLVKFDLLGLGMLSAIRYALELISEHHCVDYELATIPKEAPCVYEMLQRADSVGVFQVESRAQMATLPRLKPDCFYDLACEVALIRPGPIQGDSVHPFIRRKNGDEKITYAHPKLEKVLKRTKGIPLFQEQLMQIAVEVAGFTPSEADTLRRAMGSKRGHDKIEAMRIRLYDGMAANGITGSVADQIYERIRAFAAFGFAESHSISFALLVYASSWLKLHYPAAFCAALLNAQPMGFYSSQSLVHDAKRHGVEVLGPSLGKSLAKASLQPGDGPSQCHCLHAPQPVVRLGLGSVKHIGDELAQAIVSERDRSAFTSMADLSRRVGLTSEQVEALATAGAFTEFGGSRRDALWGAGAAATARPGQLDVVTLDEAAPAQLPQMTEPEQLIADMWATGVTPQIYPTALIRPRLNALGIVPAAGLRAIADHTRVTVGGVVTHRQRPATARGVTFLNLEDETGMLNVIVDEVVWQRYRRVARESGGLLIRGMLENSKDGVVNVLAERLERLHLGLHTKSRDFR